MTQWSLLSIWAHCYVLPPFSHLWTLLCQTHTGTKSIRVICSQIGKFSWHSHLCIAFRPDLCYFRRGFLHQLFQNVRWRIVRFLSACYSNQEGEYNKSNFHVGQDWNHPAERHTLIASKGSAQTCGSCQQQDRSNTIQRIRVIHTTKQRLVQWGIEILVRTRMVALPPFLSLLGFRTGSLSRQSCLRSS